MSQEQAKAWFGKYAAYVLMLFDVLGQFRRWFFIKGTRVVEGMNTVFLLCFSTAFFIDYDHINDLPTYSKFNVEHDKLYWTAMFIWGCLQLYAMSKVSIRSNQGSGIVLIVSAFMWMLIASLISSAVDTLTPMPYIYSAFAVLCGMAGYELLTQNKKIEDNQKQAQCNAGV